MSLHILTAPLFAAISYAAALGLAFWLSALNTAYRDVGHLLPFLLQVWFFSSPIIYTSDIVPAEYQLLWWLNPMVAAVDGWRWALAGGPQPPVIEIALGTSVALTLLVSGYVFFRYRESEFVDLA
jgi:lipopolysaccharide transport system permease protein